MMDILEHFGLKNQSLEEALIKLQESNIDIGYKKQITTPIVDPDFFSYDIVKNSEEMRKYYEAYFCIENSIRKMIKETLSTNENWWDELIPEDVKNKAIDYKNRDEGSAIDTSNDLLEYVDFGDLAKILEKNSNKFDMINNINTAKRIIQGLNKSRNIVAHCRQMSDDDKTRFTLLINDWKRIT